LFVGRRVRKKGKEQRFAEPPRVPGRRAKEEKALTVFGGNVCCFDVKDVCLFFSFSLARNQKTAIFLL
jgi:hypothetical protein